MAELSENEKRALEAFVRIVGAQQVPTVALGANARMLVLDKQYDLPTQRLTVDWDFAARVDSWASYEALAKDLIAEGVFERVPNTSQQFVHRDTGIPIDVLPFGDIANQDGLVDWPETEKQMSTLGLNAAYEHAVTIALDNETIRVATPSWHVALKLIAYSDRRAEKDLRDLDFILLHATEVFSDRVFDELGDQLADDLVGYDEAGAYLIGRDLAVQGSSPVTAALLDVLDGLLDDRNHLELRAQLLSPTQSDTNEVTLGVIVERFRALRRGIVEGSARQT